MDCDCDFLSQSQNQRTVSSENDLKYIKNIIRTIPHSHSNHQKHNQHKISLKRLQKNHSNNHEVYAKKDTFLIFPSKSPLILEKNSEKYFPSQAQLAPNFPNKFHLNQSPFLKKQVKNITISYISPPVQTLTRTVTQPTVSQPHKQSFMSSYCNNKSTTPSQVQPYKQIDIFNKNKQQKQNDDNLSRCPFQQIQEQQRMVSSQFLQKKNGKENKKKSQGRPSHSHNNHKRLNSTEIKTEDNRINFKNSMVQSMRALGRSSHLEDYLYKKTESIADGNQGSENQLSEVIFGYRDCTNQQSNKLINSDIQTQIKCRKASSNQRSIIWENSRKQSFDIN